MAKVAVTKVLRHGIPAGIRLTPMMQQYVAAKGRYPDALLFFRMGDFYEMFFGDAEVAGRHLELTVTSRDKESSVPAPMAGFPHHQLSNYLARALAAGLKVSVCDQLEDPSQAQGIVKRGITRVVTPGVVLDAEGLDARANNYLVSVVPAGAGADGGFGVAAFDVSTGELRVTEVVGAGGLRCELSRLEPRELVLGPGAEVVRAAAGDRLDEVAISGTDPRAFTADEARRLLVGRLGPKGEDAAGAIDDFGFGNPGAALCALGAVLFYVEDTQRAIPDHARVVNPYRVHDTLVLDETAKANLELFRTLMGGRKRGALLGVLDHAATAMGGRRLRHWLAYPLVEPVAINARLDAVQWLFEEGEARARLRAALQQMYDLERLNARVAAGTGGPRDLWFLRLTLEQVPALLAQIVEAAPLAELWGRLDPLDAVSGLVAAAIAEDPPGQLRDGGVVRRGFHAELDEYVALATEGKGWLAELERRERERTGISSLKVRFNKVFGYFIEISKANLRLVPEGYIRKQTLANSERYFTTELKDFEEKVLNAEARRSALEAEVFAAVRDEVAAQAPQIAATAQALAELDGLTALAEIAHRNDYHRPVVDDGDVIDIEGGRHPVVELSVGREEFVPNSVRLDRTEQSLIVLTGPNMAGKSTVMRQVALAVLMAQMGSFVPAAAARIGVVDRIFTRVGAADDLASGRSTFMVEMHETATILKEATPRSLLILDEIGRGTSTFDGVSIAWSVAEYIHDVLRAKALFATHYHELTDLAEVKPRVRNFTIAVKEWNEEVIFLRQLVPGGANRSYGIQVARLAGLPKAVIGRAREVLSNLERGEHDEVGRPRLSHDRRVALPRHNLQLSLFAPPPIPAGPTPVERELRGADLDNLSPIQALNFLHALRAHLE